MLNVSFACHMPDCLEMPYKPAILGTHEPAEGEKRWRMGGNSCLAGDYYGDWAFDGGRRSYRFSRYDPLYDGQNDHVQRGHPSFHRNLES